MSNYIIASCVSALICVLAYVTLNIDISSKLCLFKSSEAEEYESIKLSKIKILTACIVVTIITFFAVCRIVNYVNEPIGISKMIVALLCMTGAGCFDLREKRIPNIFPLFMAVCAVILLGVGVIVKQEGAVQYITLNVSSAVVCGVVLFVAAFITKQGIGAGDIKLISALALIAGVYTIIGTLLFGVVLCSVVAVIMLIIKKKTLKESLPFGPFLYIGFICTVLFMNF